MEIYPGADLIECEIVGRPLYLPVVTENSVRAENAVVPSIREILVVSR
jgi:hypothetical protein